MTLVQLDGLGIRQIGLLVWASHCCNARLGVFPAPAFPARPSCWSVVGSLYMPDICQMYARYTRVCQTCAKHMPNGRRPALNRPSTPQPGSTAHQSSRRGPAQPVQPARPPAPALAPAPPLPPRGWPRRPRRRRTCRRRARRPPQLWWTTIYNVVTARTRDQLGISA